MVPLTQGNKGAQGEWGGVIWHPHMEILTKQMVVPPTMLAVRVCVSSEGGWEVWEKGAL